MCSLLCQERINCIFFIDRARWPGDIFFFSVFFSSVQGAYHCISLMHVLNHTDCSKETCSKRSLLDSRRACQLGMRAMVNRLRWNMFTRSYFYTILLRYVEVICDAILNSLEDLGGCPWGNIKVMYYAVWNNLDDMGAWGCWGLLSSIYVSFLYWAMSGHERNRCRYLEGCHICFVTCV